MRRARLLALVALFALAACSGRGQDATPTVPGSAIYGAGISIAPETVAAVARAQNVTPRAAAESLREDAVFAAAARESGVVSEGQRESREARALGRSYARSLADASMAAPISPEDLQGFRASRWLRLDRPVARRTVHMLVPFPSDPKAAKNKDAPPPEVTPEMREFADAARAHILEVLRTPLPAGAPVVSPEERFLKAAKTTPDFGMLKAKAESLPPVAKNGQVVDDEGGTFDAKFAEAVWAVPFDGEPGPSTITPVFPTAFGLHVAFVLQATEPYRPTDDEILAAYHNEILQLRARKRLDVHIAELRSAQPIRVEPTADELMGRVVRAVTGE